MCPTSISHSILFLELWPPWTCVPNYGTYTKLTLNLKPPLCTTCIHLLLLNVHSGGFRFGVGFGTRALWFGLNLLRSWLGSTSRLYGWHYLSLSWMTILSTNMKSKCFFLLKTLKVCIDQHYYFLAFPHQPLKPHRACEARGLDFSHHVWSNVGVGKMLYLRH